MLYVIWNVLSLGLLSAFKTAVRKAIAEAAYSQREALVRAYSERIVGSKA